MLYIRYFIYRGKKYTLLQFFSYFNSFYFLIINIYFLYIHQLGLIFITIIIINKSINQIIFITKYHLILYYNKIIVIILCLLKGNIFYKVSIICYCFLYIQYNK